VSVTDANGITSYGYDAVGNLTSVSHPNGTSQVYSYDSLNRLTSLKTYEGSGALAEQYDYTLNATGRREQIDELGGRSTVYVYDDLYRLGSEAITDTINGDYSASYQYDAVGNRTYETVDGVQTAYSYDANDRLIQQGGTSYTYDANGNTLTQTLDGQTTTYTYDARDKLRAVEQGGNTTEYTYDHSGIRTSKTTSGITTDYVIDENRDYAQVLEEVTANQSDVTYSYGHDLLSQDRMGAASFYHYDGLGSTRILTDDLGNVNDEYDYEAFGELLNESGTTENDYLFSGEQFDASLNQYYLRARYYNQVPGRFTQQDTWMGNNQDPTTLHKYLYANADPGNMVDPSGNFSLGSFSVASTISATLTAVNIGTTAFSIFQIATGEEEFSARELGTNILLSLLPTKYVKIIFKKFCGKNSFIEGTLVKTENGLIPIEDIKIGDKVLTFNEETELNEYQEIIHLIHGESDYEIISIELSSGDLIKATGGHPFYVDGDWVDAAALTSNMLLSSYDESVEISSLYKKRETQKVYNLTVDVNPSYYVGKNGVLVHNANPKGCNIFNSAGEINRTISISSKQLQKKYLKHSADFGVTGNYNKARGEAFRKAIEAHVGKSTTTPIAGLYKRGNIEVVHYLDLKTGINVMKDLQGNFISGWKLSPAQLKNVLEKGTLGGG